MHTCTHSCTYTYVQQTPASRISNWDRSHAGPRRDLFPIPFCWYNVHLVVSPPNFPRRHHTCPHGYPFHVNHHLEHAPEENLSATSKSRTLPQNKHGHFPLAHCCQTRKVQISSSSAPAQTSPNHPALRPGYLIISHGWGRQFPAPISWLVSDRPARHLCCAWPAASD